MKHLARKFLVLLAVVMLTTSLAAPALALVDKTDEFYVADYANVLSPSTQKMILTQNEQLCSQTGAEIVVVTVRYLEGDYYADEYAVELFDSWGVGDAERNNGLLLLLVTDENKAWLTQGSGLRYDLTGDDIDALLDRYFWKKFDKGDFDGAVNSLFPELIEWYEDYYNFSLGDGTVIADVPLSDSQSSLELGVGIFLMFKGLIKIIAVLAIIIVIVSINKSSRRKRYGGYRTYTPPPPPMGGFHHIHRPGPGFRPPTSGNRGSSFRSTGSSFRSSSSGFRSSGGSSFRGGGGGGGRSSGGGGGRR